MFNEIQGKVKFHKLLIRYVKIDPYLSLV